jgi:hypothetical protein
MSQDRQRQPIEGPYFPTPLKPMKMWCYSWDSTIAHKDKETGQDS